MPRILAIECRPETPPRAHHARARARQGHLVVVAVGPGGDRRPLPNSTPDLLIAPTLLSPPDEAELLTHMKGLDTRALHSNADRAGARHARRTRPRADTAPSQRSLARSSTAGPVSLAFSTTAGWWRRRSWMASSAPRACGWNTRRRWPTRRRASTARANTSLVLARAGSGRGARRQQRDAFIEQQLREPARDERRIALRKGRGDVPWLSGIKVSWGAELQLINISSTGVLVETGSKFAPGSTTNLHLSGPETNLVVPVRFIRSDVARIDGLGVRYRAAAAFAQEVDLGRPAPRAGVPATPPQELAALLGAVLSQCLAASGASARAVRSRRAGVDWCP